MKIISPQKVANLQKQISIIRCYTKVGQETKQWFVTLYIFCRFYVRYNHIVYSIMLGLQLANNFLSFMKYTFRRFKETYDITLALIEHIFIKFRLSVSEKSYKQTNSQTSWQADKIRRRQHIPAFVWCKYRIHEILIKI